MGHTTDRSGVENYRKDRETNLRTDLLNAKKAVFEIPEGILAYL